MKKASDKKKSTRMRLEYDFSKGVRGRYARRFRDGSNVVLLAPDVAEMFPDSESVNKVLRKLVRASAKTQPSKSPT